MSIIILGILIIVFGQITGRRPTPLQQYARWIQIGGLALAIIGFASASIRQIGSGEVGVQTLFGKVEGNVLRSGLSVVNPLMEVKNFSIRTQNYTMSAIHSEGDQAGDDAIRVLSKDGLQVVLDVSVLYRLLPDKAPDVLREVGEDYKSVIVRPITRTRIRDFAAYYDAVALYSEKRDEFQARITKSIEQEFHKRGLVLEGILVRNIDLPQSVKASIESKINAEQDAQKMQFVLQKEKQEAERKRVEAQGIADYQKIISTQLSDKQLQYEQIKAYKEIAHSNNTKVIIIGNKGGNTPFILGDK
ncbi:MAG: prohibitin family protein [Bacteroidetes bacterium]|nr:prohibitin family protein [Bacteroidota bacterium]